ncbi:MAG: diguanylate cyclase [Deltaproteobacteria bacterium]|nr:diguanylate cyclase [Deltaproteobacteria bacterium]
MENRFPILIVEDDPVSRRLLEMTLSKAGYEVVSAKDGEEALACFNAQFFPIVFTDWMMPEMDGLQLCRSIREEVSAGYVFIFLLTARDSREDMLAGLEAGADDYLTKPFDRSELFARLKTAVRILNLEKSLKDANDAIRMLSITDTMTGCYNRTYMDAHLPHELQRARRYGHPISVLMVDIDHFKGVNDTYGHQAGDEVLKAFVQTMGRSIRSRVDWIARYGGEEFIVVLPETDFDKAQVLAERLRAKVSKQIVFHKEEAIRITASFGVTGLAPGQGVTGFPPDISHEAMIRVADKCLYAAKEAGRNKVIASPVIERP